MIQELSYIGFRSPKYQEWVEYGQKILGCQLADPGTDGAVRLRMDDVAYRIAIHPGDQDDLAYLGWGTASQADYLSYIDHIEGHGFTLYPADKALLAERQVAALSWFEDPFGMRQEISWGKTSIPCIW
jgi:hypothetical protein